MIILHINTLSQMRIYANVYQLAVFYYKISVWDIALIIYVFE